jgi:hypothetical protein
MTTQTKTIHQFIAENNIRIVRCDRVSENKSNPGWRDANHYFLTLKIRGGKQISTYFSQGYGISSEPDAANVLNCLALDSSDVENNPEFEDWVNEFGYSDLKAAKKIFQACVKQQQKLLSWLGEDLYNHLLWDVEGL